MTSVIKAFARRLIPNRMQRKLRTRILEFKRSRFKPYIVERRLGEQLIKIEVVDAKGQRWYDRDMDLDPEIFLLAQHQLQSGARVFELGAHQGIVALALAQKCGPHGSVIALEPSPFDARAALTNCQLNGASQVTVVHKAIASKCGTVNFQVSGRVAYGGATTDSLSVQSTTIDALAEQYGPPDVLFIDVDGFEVEALRGASNVLRLKPDCYLEVHPPYLKNYGYRAEDVLAFFSDSDYILFASAQMKTRLRTFQPISEANIDFRTFFHLVAISRK